MIGWNNRKTSNVCGALQIIDTPFEFAGSFLSFCLIIIVARELNKILPIQTTIQKGIFEIQVSRMPSILPC